MNSSPLRRPQRHLPVDPNRIRHLPRQFAPVDRRLVYDRHLCELTLSQMALYLFLHCVADASGLSYYSDERICQFLPLDEAALREARKDLIQHQFILYHRPLYQLLDLPPVASSFRRASPPSESPTPNNDFARPSPRERSCANGEAIPVGQLLSRWCAQGGRE